MSKTNENPSMRMTTKQKEVLEFITHTVQSENRMPSYREIAQAMKVRAVGTIQDHIRGLVQGGYLQQSHLRGKKILSLSESRQPRSIAVPIVGKVAAGSLHDAFEVSLGTLSLPLSQGTAKNPSTGQIIALQVTGDSMIDAGIFEGDYVILDRSSKIKSGDFVVVDVNGQSTVKEIKLPKRATDPTLLIPHNKRLQPIALHPADESQTTRVVGKVISVQRFLS